jgi:hypothetical protein
MSQVNNPIGWRKGRPSEWESGQIDYYVTQLELYVKQVYENLTGINQAKAYTVAELPDANSFDPVTNGRAAYVYVSDEVGGATLAFSDGANWLRVQDRAVVS